MNEIFIPNLLNKNKVTKNLRGKMLLIVEYMAFFNYARLLKKNRITRRGATVPNLSDIESVSRALSAIVLRTLKSKLCLNISSKTDPVQSSIDEKWTDFNVTSITKTGSRKGRALTGVRVHDGDKVYYAECNSSIINNHINDAVILPEDIQRRLFDYIIPESECSDQRVSLSKEKLMSDYGLGFLHSVKSINQDTESQIASYSSHRQCGEIVSRRFKDELANLICASNFTCMEKAKFNCSIYSGDHHLSPQFVSGTNIFSPFTAISSSENDHMWSIISHRMFLALLATEVLQLNIPGHDIFRDRNFDCVHKGLIAALIAKNFSRSEVYILTDSKSIVTSDNPSFEAALAQLQRSNENVESFSALNEINVNWSLALIKKHPIPADGSFVLEKGERAKIFDDSIYYYNRSYAKAYISAFIPDELYHDAEAIVSFFTYMSSAAKKALGHSGDPNV